MPNPPKNDTPDKALVERVATAIQGVKGGLNYNYADFCRDAAKAAIATLSQPQHGGLVEAIEGKSDEQLADMAYGKGYDLYRNKWIGDHEEMCADLVRWLLPRAALSNSPVVGEDALPIAPTAPVVPDREDEPTTPAGMKPWYGGPKPADWSGEAVQFRSGKVMQAPVGAVWKLGWDHSYGIGDIIAYTPKPAPADTADRREAVARLLCNEPLARHIAVQDNAPPFDDSSDEVQAYWRALASAVVPLIAGLPEGDEA